MRTGRPSKLTPQLQEQIVAAIQRGCYVETAAAMNGIAKDTFYRWLKQGAAIAAEEQPCITPHDEAMRDFSDAIKIATAQAEFRDVLVIDEAAQNGQWQAAMTRLERKHPQRWGRKVALTDEKGGNFFEGMARAWATALEADTDDQSFIEGEVVTPRLNGGSNGGAA